MTQLLAIVVNRWDRHDSALLVGSEDGDEQLPPPAALDALGLELVLLTGMRSELSGRVDGPVSHVGVRLEAVTQNARLV
jgi:hypothetical protein